MDPPQTGQRHYYGSEDQVGEKTGYGLPDYGTLKPVEVCWQDVRTLAPHLFRPRQQLHEMGRGFRPRVKVVDAEKLIRAMGVAVRVA